MNGDELCHPRLRRCAPHHSPCRVSTVGRASRKLKLLFTVPALLLAGCHHLAPPTPLDQLNAEQQAGYTAFQTHCAFCHYERTDESKQGPSLVGIFKKPSLHSGAPANDERVTYTILHGHGLMPAQPNLDPDTLSALLAYLHTV